MEIDEFQLYWLAGLLEGEGSFLKGPPSAPHQPRIALMMTDEDVIAKVAALWKVKYHPSGKDRSLARNWAFAFIVSLKGSRAVTLMQQLKPLMGQRRQTQIDAALACYFVKPHPTTRLNEQSVRCIKNALKDGLPAKELALTHNVNVFTIYKIKQGQSWKWVE